MKQVLIRFITPLFILLLILLAWVIFGKDRFMVNPDAQAAENIIDKAIILFKDDGNICFFVNEQTGKLGGKITNSLPVVLGPSRFTRLRPAAQQMASFPVLGLF